MGGCVLSLVEAMSWLSPESDVSSRISGDEGGLMVGLVTERRRAERRRAREMVGCWDATARFFEDRLAVGDGRFLGGGGSRKLSTFPTEVCREEVGFLFREVAATASNSDNNNNQTSQPK